MTSRKPSALEAYLNQNRNPQLSPSSPHSQPAYKNSPSTNDSGSWETNFFNSKNECLSELNRLIRKVDKEESRVRSHMKQYQLGVLDRLDKEYSALKAELCRILDGAYQRCIIKVKEGFLGEEMGELERALRRLEGIRQKIRSFEFELQTNYTYKKGIAHVVMENFEAQRAELVGSMNAALKCYEGKVFLKVQPHEFAKMKEALHNLFSYTGNYIPAGQHGNRASQTPRMFPPPSPPLPSNVLQPIPNSFQPITSVNEGVVPDPHLVPPFKPFPPKRPDSNVQDPSQNHPRQEDYPSGIRYAAPNPNPDFDEIFNNQSPSKARNRNEQIACQPNQRGSIPNMAQNRSSSPSPSSHRNRDFIRQSGRSKPNT